MGKSDGPVLEIYEDDSEVLRTVPDIEDLVDSNGRLINQLPAYDHLLNPEVQLQLGNELTMGKVKCHALGPEGKVVGQYDDNPFLNSMTYEVKFVDGQVWEYSAIVIAQNMLTRVDSEGFSTSLMEGIVDCCKDESVAVTKTDKYVYTKSGQWQLRKTTAGWDMLVRWKDQMESWIKLSDMKESHPVEMAEFAKLKGIDDKSAFAWWNPYALGKRDMILSSIKVCVQKRTHKYGIKILMSVEHAMELDRCNKNTMWRDALAKEMYNVGVAFKVLEEGQQAPAGLHKVTGNLICDVKMDFTWKARWVLYGHKTPDPIGSMFAGVVSRESVRITFTYATLNGLDIRVANICNAYLQAPSSQLDYIICGPEFGVENVIDTQGFVWRQVCRKDCRNHLRSCMHDLSFFSFPANPDIWMRKALKADSLPCYDYVLLYMDDTLVVSKRAEAILREEIG